MTDPRVLEAVVHAVLAQLRVEEAACACHSVAAGCCPDRLGRMLGHGAERFGLQAGANLYPRDIAGKIDHTLLKPEATREQIVLRKPAVPTPEPVVEQPHAEVTK